jgi:hypothetical protein
MQELVACSLHLVTVSSLSSFLGAMIMQELTPKNVVLFSKGLLSKYHCKCKRVAFHQGLQEVEVYSKECKLPESMARI